MESQIQNVMKKNIAIMAGGDSSEWQISLGSASQIEKIIDRSKYNAYKVTLRNGRWYHTSEDGSEWDVDRNDFSLTVKNEKIKFDYALILIHGTPGEDGRLQGYLDMMKIPYSSSGFFASAITFDKSACKRAVSGTGIHLAKEILLAKDTEIDTKQIVEKLGLPMFVKPNASGSSFGVTKVKSEEQLIPAIEEAFKESDHVIIEEFIEGREVSCGVMVAGGKEYIFPVTELICDTEFFTYEAKYQGASREVTPAQLPDNVTKALNKATLLAYKTLGCRGVARVDFIIKEDTPYMIEINTVPGMSAASIIPQQAAAMGMNMTELFNIIIDDTINR